MIIIDNEKIINTFENIEVGEVFQCENFGSGTYMKIWEVADRGTGDWYNAVCLNGGDLTIIPDNEKVSIFPKAKVILN